MRYLFAAAALVVIPFGLYGIGAEAAPEKRRVVGVTLGCLSPIDTETWVKIDVVADDKIAKEKFFNDKVEQLGSCRILSVIDAVEMEKTANYNGRVYVCVRPEGDYRCWHIYEGYYNWK